MRNRLLWLGAVGTMLTGCATTSTFGLARTLNKGAVQGWVAPSGGAIIVTAPRVAVQGYPLVEGGFRAGLTDNIELGARLGFGGIAVEGKFGLIRSPTMDSGFNLSLNPQVQFVGFPVPATATTAGGFVGALSLHLPVLFGIDFKGHELIFGPRVIDQILFGSGTGTAVANLVYFGGTIGFAIRIAPGFRILPEVSVSAPVIGSAGGNTNAAFGAIIFQAGVGFLFGSAHQYEPKASPPARPEPLPAEEFTPPPMPPAEQSPPPV